MSDIFYKKKGATLPVMVVTLDWEGGADDLTSATGVVKFRHQFGQSYEKDVVIPDQNLYPRKLEVRWTEEDDDEFLTYGQYYLEYHITFPNDEGLAIFPTEGTVTYDRLEVQPSLA